MAEAVDERVPENSGDGGVNSIGKRMQLVLDG
jgi:hypothetical protein